MKKRKVLIAALIVLPLTQLPALSFSAGASVASKYTNLDGWVWPVAIQGTVDDFDLGLNIIEDHSLDTAFYWHYRDHESFRADLGTGYHHRWENGSLWTLTGAFGQDFPFDTGWFINWRIGIELAVAWSEWSPDFVSPGLSPYLVFEGGWRNDLFNVRAYFTSEKMFEKTHQTLPIVGLELGWDMNDNNALSLDCYYKVADYMAKPDRLISDAEFRLAYTYKGDI